MPQLVVSAAEHRALQDELRLLRVRRDRDLPERLREARTYVSADAQEEIAQIQDAQAVADSRIAHIEELLALADVLEDAAAVGVVSIGCAVEVEYVRTGKRATYRLVGSGTRLGLGIVSARSPIGQALMGRTAGEDVAATLPSGRAEQLRIVDVRAPTDDVVGAGR